MLFDYSCPVGSGPDFVMPTVVLIEKPKFSKPELGEKLRGLSEKEVYHALVQGRLECRKPFSVKVHEDGDIDPGKGYGDWGLYRCRMRDATFLTLHILETK